MNSFDRTLTAIGHNEPDRVPLFFLLSNIGAKYRNISIKEYFSKPDIVANTQIEMRKEFSSDCYYNFHYAPLEIEAWGGEVIFYDDGPPNSGDPFIKKISDIDNLDLPDIENNKKFQNVLEVTSKIKEKDGTAPIIAVVMSPFSLPVMQMGFENYLNLLYFDQKRFERLMEINTEFCVKWANMQVKAGASAICYFDPLSSPSMIEIETTRKTGFKIAKKTISRINAPVAAHLASGIALPVVDDIIDTGALVLGFSNDDNIEEIKKKSQGKICLLGNLNGVEMIDWDEKTAFEKAANIVKNNKKNGGFILSDNHGEIPYQVKFETLKAIASAVDEYGRYL